MKTNQSQIAVGRVENDNHFLPCQQGPGCTAHDLAYDPENRLVEVKKNSVVMGTFVYNGDGQWVRQTR